jgi:hypothetical protein
MTSPGAKAWLDFEILQDGQTTIEIKYARNNTPNTSQYQSPLKHISNLDYFQIKSDKQGFTANVAYYWSHASGVNPYYGHDIRLAGYNGLSQTWQALANHQPWTAVSANNINLDTFTQFSMGSITGGVHSFRQSESAMPAMVSLEVYPNPATDFVNIRSDCSGILSIVSLDGKKLRKHSLTAGKSRISLAGIAPGQYFLRLRKGEVIKTQKLTVK